ncbi:MAG: hypothetical protein SNJ82_12755 [Gemmataceae bacterium]
MTAQRPRRIGVHAIRGAGKTSWFGTLYGFRSTPGIKIDVADDASCRYLAGVWKELSEGRTPGATVLSFPETLRLDLTVQEVTKPLEICDYAGALVQAKEQDASPTAEELSEVLRDWLRGCHAILLFLDSTQPEMEQLDALDLLLTELRRDALLGLNRPMAIVLTKWDQQGTIGDDLERERQRAQYFLRDHHVFMQIMMKLSDAQGNQVRLFPLSSFGNSACGTQPPLLGEYRPCHLYAPLLWAAEVSDRVLLEQTRQRAEQHLKNWWPDFPAAEREWERLLREAEPLRESVEVELHKLKLRQQRQRGQMLVPLACLAGLLALGGLYARQQAHQQAQITLAFAESATGYDRAAERLVQQEAFLNRWSSWLVPGLRSEIATLAQADRRAVAEQQEREAFLSELAACEQTQNWQQACERIDDYLQRYPDCPLCRELQPRSEQAHRQRDRQQALQSAQSLERQGRFAQAEQVYRRYLHEQPDSPWREEFEDLARQASHLERDADDYNTLRQLVQDGGGTSLEEAGRKAIAYLESRHPVRAMRAEVSRFLDWFERLRAGMNVYVILERVDVRPDCSLRPTVGYTNPRVRLTINKVTHQSGWLGMSNTTPGQRLGPFPVKYGEPGLLQLGVEAKRNLVRNPWALGEYSDPRHIAARVNSTLVARCDKNGEVHVRLSCKELLPPELPPYRRP